MGFQGEKPKINLGFSQQTFGFDPFPSQGLNEILAFIDGWIADPDQGNLLKSSNLKGLQPRTCYGLEIWVTNCSELRVSPVKIAFAVTFANIFGRGLAVWKNFGMCQGKRNTPGRMRFKTSWRLPENCWMFMIPLN
jgi:hypothetical protein